MGSTSHRSAPGTSRLRAMVSSSTYIPVALFESGDTVQAPSDATACVGGRFVFIGQAVILDFTHASGISYAVPLVSSSRLYVS